MSTPTTTAADRLSTVFDEIDRTDRLVANQRQAQADEQKRVDAAQALLAAAQIQFKNAEARYSVLARSTELAAPEIKALRARRAEQQSEFDLTERELQTARDQAERAERAQGELRELFRRIQEAATEAALAVEAVSRSADDLQNLPPAALKTAAVKNVIDEVRTRHRDLQERRARYEPVLRDLETAIETLRLGLPAAEYLRSLTARRDRLERDLAETERELLAKQPDVDPADLAKAEDDLRAAKRAADDAPRAVQRAQAEFQMATDSLAQAERRQQAAQNELDAAEAEFVAGIEVSAPNAAGFVTAKARLIQDIPAGYTLRWQAAGAPVEPATGEAVRIDTNPLPVGDTRIEAQLVREPAHP